MLVEQYAAALCCVCGQQTLVICRCVMMMMMMMCEAVISCCAECCCVNCVCTVQVQWDARCSQNDADTMCCWHDRLHVDILWSLFVCLSYTPVRCYFLGRLSLILSAIQHWYIHSQRTSTSNIIIL